MTHVVFQPLDIFWRGWRRWCREGRPEPAKRQALSGAQRLKRVFRIEAERCGRCGGQMKVIAAIEESGVIERILTQVGRWRSAWL